MVLAILPKNSKIEGIAPDALPASWRDFVPGETLQVIGREPVKGKSTVVLAVPSTVIRAEISHLLNLSHAVRMTEKGADQGTGNL